MDLVPICQNIKFNDYDLIMAKLIACNPVSYCCCANVLRAQIRLTRSPWSNKYEPPISDGAVPSDKLRSLEVKANQAFDTYREM